MPEAAHNHDDAGLWRSARLSVTAAHRLTNEDAWLDVPERGLWAVADGMGGHSLGAKASRTVIRGLSDKLLPLGGDVSETALAERAALAEEELAAIHERLVSMGQALNPPGVVGSTVVLLLAATHRARLFWIGDSRAYLMRERALHQITTDHARIIPWVDLPSQPAPPRPRQVLTQALGRAAQLSIGRLDIELLPQDRLLLCSDGFYKMLGDLRIAQHLAHPVGMSMAALRRMLEIEAPSDDLTVILIERTRTLAS